MIVYNREEAGSSKVGCYPSLSELYSVIPRDVRLHMERVGIYAEIFCNHLLENEMLMFQLEKEFVEHARALFTLHDIGKVFVPVAILNKAGKLTPEEYEIVKSHTIMTPDVLDSIYYFRISDFLKQKLLNIALYHHERWDGGGYPFGLKEGQIPIEASICALVDSYDAMTSWKPYRSPLTDERIKRIILEEGIHQFHPGLARAFVSCMGKFPRNLNAAWEAKAGKYFYRN